MSGLGVAESQETGSWRSCWISGVGKTKLTKTEIVVFLRSQSHKYHHNEPGLETEEKTKKFHTNVFWEVSLNSDAV